MAIKVTVGGNQALYCCLIVDCTLVTVLLRGATFAPPTRKLPVLTSGCNRQSQERLIIGLLLVSLNRPGLPLIFCDSRVRGIVIRASAMMACHNNCCYSGN